MAGFSNGGDKVGKTSFTELLSRLQYTFPVTSRDPALFEQTVAVDFNESGQADRGIVLSLPSGIVDGSGEK